MNQRQLERASRSSAILIMLAVPLLALGILGSMYEERLQSKDVRHAVGQFGVALNPAAALWEPEEVRCAGEGHPTLLCPRINDSDTVRTGGADSRQMNGTGAGGIGADSIP